MRFSRIGHQLSPSKTEGRKQSHPNFSAMGVGRNVEGPSYRFWIKFQKQSVFAAYTPFVLSLASGRLELETFRKYIAQDVYFLRAFVQAYDMVEDCADDDDAKAAICYLRNRALEEKKMYDFSMKEWGVDLAKESSPNPATLKYTDFLLATASGKVEGGKGPARIATPFEKTKLAAYTLGAVTPCMRLYAFLGKELQSCLDPAETSHPYKKWIGSYASESFEAATMQTEEMLDKLSISLTGEELEVIERLYHEAMNLLIEFLSAQPIVHRTVVPFSRMQEPAERHLVIFSDFDSTCTVVDSSAILAEIAILTAPKADPSGPENPIVRKSSADLRSSWDVLSSQYTEEHEQWIQSIMPSERVNAFNYEGLCKALEQLSDFEKRANSRVIESGVLKGLNLEGIKRAGERLILQDGCVGFFQQIVKKKEELNADVHILSYCWCGDLIRSAFSSGGLNVLNVRSNEFAYEESISTGKILQKVESPMDKLRDFKDILKNCSEGGKRISVYIGDSVGDLLCLLEADVGIVIGSSSTLRRVGRQFGVFFVPLFPALVKKQKEFIEGVPSTWKGLTGTLYRVSSWAEIHAFILGLHNHL
ncbi:bifunctional TH2 protein, mitochondrial-like [Magnolia sinica]|uniref:bifunctional TH2 protein, mitochondrial-like n=1 Tax=Magnolia sinica TaxID=86752 RepID=UPI002659380E|nr:bifunctional TH2 protein, mitochondrial-like [Magnolia sinica]XP_058070596.1 bifunctional TH2 protein, mitochondrial-like [Magnolia sinica]